LPKEREKTRLLFAPSLKIARVKKAKSLGIKLVTMRKRIQRSFLLREPTREKPRSSQRGVKEIDTWEEERETKRRLSMPSPIGKERRKKPRAVRAFWEKGFHCMSTSRKGKARGHVCDGERHKNFP